MNIKTASQIVRKILRENKDVGASYLVLFSKEGKLWIGVTTPYTAFPTEILVEGQDFCLAVGTWVLDLIIDENGIEDNAIATGLPDDDDRITTLLVTGNRPKGAYEYRIRGHIPEDFPPSLEGMDETPVATIEVAEFLEKILELSRITPPGFFLFLEASKTDFKVRLMATQLDKNTGRWCGHFFVTAELTTAFADQDVFTLVPRNIIDALKKACASQFDLLRPSEDEFVIRIGGIDIPWKVPSLGTTFGNNIDNLKIIVTPLKDLENNIFTRSKALESTVHYDMTIPKKSGYKKGFGDVYLQFTEERGWITTNKKDVITMDSWLPAQCRSVEFREKLWISRFDEKYIHKLLSASNKTFKVTLSPKIVSFRHPLKDSTLITFLLAPTELKLDKLPKAVQRRVDEYGLHPFLHPDNQVQEEAVQPAQPDEQTSTTTEEADEAEDNNFALSRKVTSAIMAEWLKNAVFEAVEHDWSKYPTALPANCRRVGTWPYSSYEEYHCQNCERTIPEDELLEEFVSCPNCSEQMEEQITQICAREECGHKSITGWDVFCAACGTDIEPHEKDAYVCHQCQIIIDPQQAFHTQLCPKCFTPNGAKLLIKQDLRSMVLRGMV